MKCAFIGVWIYNLLLYKIIQEQMSDNVVTSEYYGCSAKQGRKTEPYGELLVIIKSLTL